MWFLGPTVQTSHAGWRRSYWLLPRVCPLWRHPTRHLDLVHLVFIIILQMCNKSLDMDPFAREPNFSIHCAEELRCLSHPKGRQIVQQICHSMTFKIKPERGEAVFGGCGNCPEISWSCWTVCYFYHCSADFEVSNVGIPYWKSWIILVKRMFKGCAFETTMHWIKL